MESQRDGSALNVRAERIGSRMVLYLEGRLTADADMQRLGELARWVRELDGSDMILDLGNVRQLDCCGIGQLVRIHNQVCRWGSTLTLVNVERRQKRLLQLAGLPSVFRVFDSSSPVRSVRPRLPAALVGPSPPD